jgi:hypothetical protein
LIYYCVQKYTFNKKRSEESSRNVCSADLKDSLGKEELYLRKIFKKMMFEIIIVYGLVSTCSSILNVYVASCFFIYICK